MSVRSGGSFSLFIVSCAVRGAVAIAASACEQGSEPPPEVPKAAERSSRPPDVTEVTMEVSSAAPPGESAPPGAASSAPIASGAGAGTGTGIHPATTASSGPDPSDDSNIGGAQPDPAVEKAVAPVRPRLRACYKKALAAEPNVGGSATFDATIGKDGKVASARFVKRDGLNEDMVGCLLVAVKSMTFDTSRKSQIVTLSFGSAASSGSSGTPGVMGSPPATPPSAADAGAADAGAKR